MRVTKFVHSCLLVETSDLKTLIDPGKFTFDSHLLNITKIGRLDYIVITHEHPDHFDEHFLGLLSEHSPRTPIVSNNDLLKKLAKLKLPNPLQGGSDDNLQIFEAVHEPLPLNMPSVLNIGLHIADKLTCPGDSYDFKNS